MKVGLVSYWKECWKLSSFQLSLLVLCLEWLNNLSTGLPDTPAEIGRSVVLLLLPIARLIRQTSVQITPGESS